MPNNSGSTPTRQRSLEHCQTAKQLLSQLRETAMANNVRRERLRGSGWFGWKRRGWIGLYDMLEETIPTHGTDTKGKTRHKVTEVGLAIDRDGTIYCWHDFRWQRASDDLLMWYCTTAAINRLRSHLQDWAKRQKVHWP